MCPLFIFKSIQVEDFELPEPAHMGSLIYVWLRDGFCLVRLPYRIWEAILVEWDLIVIISGI